MAEGSTSAGRPEWSSAPWRPKPGIRANPVTRKPQRKAVSGCATGANSVPALVSQQGVAASAADGWLHLGAQGGAYGRHGDALARTRTRDGAGDRPFFAEPVPDARPRSLREALARKSAGADPERGVAGEPTASKHLRSAAARHQREQLRRAAGPDRAGPPRPSSLKEKLGAMERTPPGRIIAWAAPASPVADVKPSRRNAESSAEAAVGQRAGPRTVYAETPAGRVLSWPEAADAAAVADRKPSATFVPLRDRQARPAPREAPAFRAAHDANVADRTELARKLGAVSRTPPGRVIGWTPA